MRIEDINSIKVNICWKYTLVNVFWFSHQNIQVFTKQYSFMNM